MLLLCEIIKLPVRFCENTELLGLTDPGMLVDVGVVDLGLLIDIGLMHSNVDGVVMIMVSDDVGGRLDSGGVDFGDNLVMDVGEIFSMDVGGFMIMDFGGMFFMDVGGFFLYIGCGNGVFEFLVEICDDGNNRGSDGCSPMC